MSSTTTARDRAKAERTDALLQAASAQFAERGYSGVSLEEIGAAVGVSGPAVYRHFPGKQALLGAVLVRVSAELVEGGTRVAETSANPLECIGELVRFHVGFALGNPDIIRVQDRDLAHLSDADRDEVRQLQRTYIALWIAALDEIRPAGADEQRLRAQACFGLINSTPHSTRASLRARAETARVLCTMAMAALLAEPPASERD